jgi:hypothetical protein
VRLGQFPRISFFLSYSKLNESLSWGEQYSFSGLPGIAYYAEHAYTPADKVDMALVKAKFGQAPHCFSVPCFPLDVTLLKLFGDGFRRRYLRWKF